MKTKHKNPRLNEFHPRSTVPIPGRVTGSINGPAILHPDGSISVGAGVPAQIRRMKKRPQRDPERYKLKMYLEDMGSFTQPGCTDKEDALWHINSARAHDGLDPIDLDRLQELLDAGEFGSTNWATFEPA
jgi:hypothetical protein